MVLPEDVAKVVPPPGVSQKQIFPTRPQPERLVVGGAVTRRRGREGSAAEGATARPRRRVPGGGTTALAASGPPALVESSSPLRRANPNFGLSLASAIS